MKTFILTAFSFFLSVYFLNAQTNCDSLIRTYGNEHVSSKLFITNDGSYLFAGRFQSTEKDSAIYLLKTDSCGNQQWSKLFGANPGYQNYYAKAFDQSSAGNIVALINADSAVSYSNNQMRVLKINANGKLLWTSIYAETNLDIVPFGICATADGGALVGGWKGFWFSASNTALLVKFNTNGKVQWAKTYGSGLISSIKQTNDGGYTFIRVKWTKSQVHSYLYKTDSQGNTIWSVETPPFNKNKYYSQNSDDAIYVLPQAADSSYTVVRTTNPGFYPDTIYLSKYNNTGTELWTKTYAYLSYQLITSIENTNNNDYLLGGYYSQQNDTFGIYLMRLNKNGDTIFTKKLTHSHIDYIDSTPDIYTSGADAYETANNKYAVGGLQQTNTQHGSHRNIRFASMLIKFNVDNNPLFAESEIYNKQKSKRSLQIFPNPASLKCTVQLPLLKSENAQLQIVDLYGRIVQSININSSQKYIQLNTSALKAGEYLIRITSNDKRAAVSSKLIVK